MKKILIFLTAFFTLFIVNNYAGISIGDSPEHPAPVELVSFSAAIEGNRIILTWETATEVDNYGFEIERAFYQNQNAEFISLGFTPGHGNSNSPKKYSFTDFVSESGTYFYRLKQIDADGKFTYSTILEVNIGSPQKFELSQNFPNPVSKNSSGNSATTITYSIPSVTNRIDVSLKVFDLLGREVAELVNETQAPGHYSVTFNAAELPSGIYIYALRAGNMIKSKKLTVIK